MDKKINQELNAENKNLEKHLIEANLKIKKLKYFLCIIITLVLCFTGFGLYDEIGGTIGAIIGLGISVFINP